MKVVNDLAHRGLLETTRGRGGGLRLQAEPDQIRIGDVVQATETDFRLVDASTPRPTRARYRRPAGWKHLSTMRWPATSRPWTAPRWRI